MAITLYASHDRSASGAHLVHVTFERMTEAHDVPTIEVIYELQFPGDFSITSQTRFLILRSITRTDTREPVQIPPEEAAAVQEKAAEHAADLTYDW